MQGARLLRRYVAPDAARRIGAVTERQFSPSELGRLLQACGDAGVRHVPLFQRAIVAALPRVGGWAAADVVGLVRALSTAGVRHEGLMATVVAAVVARRQQFSDGQVAAVMSACRRLKCSTGQLSGGQRGASGGAVAAKDTGAAGDGAVKMEDRGANLNAGDGGVTAAATPEQR
jgi:hypothetical protein